MRLHAAAESTGFDSDVALTRYHSAARNVCNKMSVASIRQRMKSDESARSVIETGHNRIAVAAGPTVAASPPRRPAGRPP